MNTSRGQNRLSGLFEAFRIDDDDSTTGSDLGMDFGSDESSHGILSDPFRSSSSESDDDAHGETAPAAAAKRQRVSEQDAAGQRRGSDDRSSVWLPVQPPEPERDAATMASFLPRNVGPRHAPPKDCAPIGYFELFFDKEMMVHIVKETNRYAAQFLSDDDVAEWVRDHPHSRFKKWPADGITVAMLKKHFGLTINMGLVRKKRLTEFWSTTPSQATPYFNSVMPYWLYFLINRMLHVNDNATEVPRGEEGFDPWHKVRPVLDRVNDSFKRHYIPSENISIDESMIGMKNRIVFIQYMPNKRHARFGIKKFEQCDSNGYIYHVELYAGKDFDIRHEEGQSHGVVMTLMEKSGLLNKGYHLYRQLLYQATPR